MTICSNVHLTSKLDLDYLNQHWSAPDTASLIRCRIALSLAHPALLRPKQNGGPLSAPEMLISRAFVLFYFMYGKK